MTYEDYISIIKKFNGILKNYPTDEDTFKLHYALIMLRIKTTDDFRRAMFEHLKKSHWWPTHIELYKHTLKEFPLVTAEEILRADTPNGAKLKAVLKLKYGLLIPDVGEWRFRTSTVADYNEWLSNIQRCLFRLKDDYENLKISYDEIFADLSGSICFNNN